MDEMIYYNICYMSDVKFRIPILVRIRLLPTWILSSNALFGYRKSLNIKL